MKYPKKVRAGDSVAILGLSSGILGEPFVSHEIPLLEKRLSEEFGLKIKYMKNAKKGADYLKKHPEDRANDLKQAFLDKDVSIIWSTIGGDDTFRTLPYLMNAEFRNIVQNNPKLFLGMSDTTNNHLMLYQMGLMTYYAPALLTDIAELGPTIFQYTSNWIKKLFANEKNIEIKSSPVWYESRESFGPDQLGVPRKEHKESHGHEFLHGSGDIEGELLGGCLDSLYECLAGGRYDDQKDIFTEYPIFPKKEIWQNKVIFLETSEERPSPTKFDCMLSTLSQEGVFDVAKALLVGKPQNEFYYDEYKKSLIKLAKKYNLPTVYNLNFGHTTPRMIIPYGGRILINFEKQQLTLIDGLIKERKTNG